MSELAFFLGLLTVFLVACIAVCPLFISALVLMGKKHIAVWPLFVLVHSFVPKKYFSWMVVCSFHMFFSETKPERCDRFCFEHVFFKHQNLSGVAAFFFTGFVLYPSGVTACY